MDWGIRLVLLLGFPAMMGMIMLREPIIRVLFMRGEFGIEAANHSALSLIASVSGIWAIMLVRVLVPGFNARQDTKTPVKFGIISMGVNIASNLIIVFPLEKYLIIDGSNGYGYIGLAVSTTISAIVNASLLFWGLNKHGIYRTTRTTWFFILKLIIGTAVMSVVIGFFKNYLASDMSDWAGISLMFSIMWLAVLIAAGALVYFLVLLCLGIRPAHLRG
jgi:putative peptidoglycan lipid II flippase